MCVSAYVCVCIDMSTDGTADCKFTTLSMCVVVVVSVVIVVGGSRGKGARHRGGQAAQPAEIADNAAALPCVAFACHFLV